MFTSVDLDNGFIKATHNISLFPLMNAAQALVNWSQRVDAIAVQQDVTIIFQGERITSWRCKNGHFKLTMSKFIDDVLENVNGLYPVDTAMVVDENFEQDLPFGMGNLMMVKGNRYIKCPVAGNDVRQR